MFFAPLRIQTVSRFASAVFCETRSRFFVSGGMYLPKKANVISVRETSKQQEDGKTKRVNEPPASE